MKLTKFRFFRISESGKFYVDDFGGWTRDKSKARVFKSEQELLEFWKLDIEAVK